MVMIVYLSRKMSFFDQVHNTFVFIKTVKDLVYTISIINMYTLISDIDGGNLKRPFFCPLFNPHSLIYLYVYFEKKYFLNYIQPSGVNIKKMYPCIFRNCNGHL